MRPTLRPTLAGKGRAVRNACLALLRAGFAMLCRLPGKRCALTAPFHPYLGPCGPGRYIFCCTFRGSGIWPRPPGLWPLNGFEPAPCLVEFGSSSPPASGKGDPPSAIKIRTASADEVSAHPLWRWSRPGPGYSWSARCPVSCSPVCRRGCCALWAHEKLSRS